MRTTRSASARSRAAGSMPSPVTGRGTTSSPCRPASSRRSSGDGSSTAIRRAPRPASTLMTSAAACPYPLVMSTWDGSADVPAPCGGGVAAAAWPGTAATRV
ncbi:hypothetical protein [Nonomuraea angiospora]